MSSIRFLFPNVLFEPPLEFRAGFPDDFRVGSVDERWKEKYGVWIVRTGSELYGMSAICTHLGCTPNWFESEGKFRCPCHGSAFNSSGINIEGPAPRPLERYRIVLAHDGQIIIDKRRVFRQERGEWNNKEARLLV